MAELSSKRDTEASQTAAATRVPVRLAYFISHPIQYQVPLIRRIAQEPDIAMTVYYFSDISTRGYHDKGFGVTVQWDIPLLDGYKYEFLPTFRDRGSLSFADPIVYGIYSRLRRGRFQAVWLHGYNTLNCLHVLFAARLLGIPVLIRTDSSLSDRIRSKTTLMAKNLFFSIIGNSIHGVLSVGQANTDYWKHHLGADIPVFPMPYAVDNQLFRAKALEATPDREALRQELNLEPGRPVILFASKLQGRKRCIDLVEAYIRLSPSPGIDPYAYLLIVGDGEERTNVENRIRESGLDSIRMLGFRNQSELPRFFDLCDLFVLPSIHEPYGLVVNEVMNAARPIVVSDQVGCQADLVQNGVNGFVYPALHVEALAEKLAFLLTNEPLRKSMGENSLRLIQKFSFEQDVLGLRQALAFTVPGFRV